MKISEVSVIRVQGLYTPPNFPSGNRQALQLDIYPEFNVEHASGKQESHAIQANYVVIDTNDGISGQFGPIDGYQIDPILRSLRPLLLGRDPLTTELLFDLMVRMDRHGRSGYFMTGVSAVDCALWDLKGKAWNQPVYRLLGGPVRPRIPAYASLLSFSTEPSAAASLAAEYKALGYTAQKWFFRYGPGNGHEGLEKNLEMARAVRETVGSHYRLMFDAFMGWDMPYAREMLTCLAPLNPTWMEEPIPPERVGSFVELRRHSSVPIATGEHVYTRWQAKELLVAGAVDFLQNDPDWTGGISELVKVCALSSSFDVPVVAHGHSLLPALHVAASQSPATVPYVEFLIRHQAHKQALHKRPIFPIEGSVELPTEPGLGFEIDEGKIESREFVSIG
jgi:L-alanine-DL-glutamate epimerase-like enolase superfamily enzyme